MSSKIDLEELKRILPELVRTNDEIKGAIISALSGVVATKEDIERLIAQSNAQFLSLQKEMAETRRQMDERFATQQKEMAETRRQMDERFATQQKEMAETRRQMDERFAAQRKEMDERFAAQRKEMDERFAAQRKEMDERFAAQQKQIAEGFSSLQKQIDEIRVDVATLANKEGQELETLILKLMKETLLLNNVNPDKIRKETLVDSSGDFFGPNYSTDIDVILENGNVYLVEVKAKADSRDFYYFKRVGQLYERERQRKVSRLIMVSLRINEKTIQHGKNTGIQIISGSILYSD